MKKTKNKNKTQKVNSRRGNGRASYYLVLLALMGFFALYLSMNFRYTLITMEGDDFWVLTWGYWQLKLIQPPALTNWLADFLIQFFASAYSAAGIITMTLGAIALLAHAVLRRLFGTKWHLNWLGLLPSILLGFCCTFCPSFQLQCLFFFTCLYGFLLMPGYKWKLLASVLTASVGFLLMQTPILAILLVAEAAYIYKGDGAKKCLYWLLPLIILVVTPLAYSQQVAFIPSAKRYTHCDTYFDALTSKHIKEGEYIRKLVCLSNEKRWEDLLYKEHVRIDAQRGNATALRYALLAESALGTLPENLLDYPIRDENLFLYPHQRVYVTLQLNRLFYENLGIYDEAFHHAQEYSLLMMNGDCFSSLRQMVDYSIEEGEWEIAEKYLHILSKSSCHKDFVDERRAVMETAKKSFAKEIPLRADNFVGGYPLPVEMLRLARYYGDVSQRKKMVDYAICSYLLRGDVNSFLIAIKAFDIYKEKELPRAYRIFLEAQLPQSQ